MESDLTTVLRQRYSRRAQLAQIVGAGTAGLICPSSGARASTSTLRFAELPHGFDERHHVAAGYKADILIRWGDAVLPDATAFTPAAPTAAAQARQFGFNNDYIAFMPLPKHSRNSDHGLLCVNHEYPIGYLMFPGCTSRADAARRETPEQLRIEQQAVGMSIVEVRREAGQWRVVSGSKYARRLTAMTEMTLTGPAAAHARVKTAADPSGRKVFGTLGNCAGGVTPWGTVLTGEENVQEFFWGDQEKAAQAAPRELASWRSFGVGLRRGAKDRPDEADPLPEPLIGWYRVDDRFDIEKNPHEPNRFGWVVEIDPYTPGSVPKKRTALGRIRHEGATVVAKHGRPVVVYSGDDQEFQCIYRFVSHGLYDETDQAKNVDLLETGDLYAARLLPDGKGVWIKLSPDQPSSQPADWALDARQIARERGATMMDRPEDIETSPLNDRTYIALTKNPDRLADLVDSSNPMAKNHWGHIIELRAPGRDGAREHTAETFAWDFLALSGAPDNRLHPGTTADGWFANPDNLAFDPRGRLWIATDGMPGSAELIGARKPVHDGIWAMDVDGDGRALARHFFGGPYGAELTGLCFTPDGTTLFASIQHPAEGKGSSFDKPSTRWPDFDANLPPRPSVVAITEAGGGIIGD